jgi:predicted thioesterase
MFPQIIAGLTYVASEIVKPENTARHYGSGLVDVYATPAMVALMEKAALMAVLPNLPDGFNTVGIEINVKHTKATPLGMEVKSEAILKEVDGKRLVFDVVAWDQEGEIGRGTHVRYIIETSKFMARLASKG